MAKVLLHLGAHKTGTTFIQEVMRKNSKLLLEQGVSYLGGREAREGFTRDLIYPAVGLNKNINKSREALVGDARGYLRAAMSEGEDLLFSNENVLGFCNLKANAGKIYPRASEISSFLEDVFKGYDVQVVFFVRSYSDFIESTYIQKIKEGETFSFDDYIESTEVTAVSWQNCLAALSNSFGKKSIKVVSYESFKERQREVILGMLSFFEGSFDELKLDSSNNINMSYSDVALRLATIGNSFLDKGDIKDYRNFLLQRFPSTSYGKPVLLEGELREKFDVKYKIDCDQLVDTYSFW